MATRWGILSVGMISHDFCTALKLLPPEEHQITAVASRDIERAAEFAAKYAIPRAYGSYEELAKAKDVDVVYVATFNPGHKEHCILMLRNGKNVLCEKPMTLNRKEQEEVFKVAAEEGRFFMEGLWSRCFPVYQKIRDELAAGVIGDVKIVQATLTVPLEGPTKVTDPSLGGGASLYISMYPIQFALMAFGGQRPVKVVATGVLFDSGPDKCESITLLFKDGGMAVLTASASAAMAGHAVIIGSKGTIQIPEFFWCPTKVITPSGTFHEPLPDVKTILENSAGFKYEAECVRRCLLEGKTECSAVTHEDSVIIMEIIDEVRRQLGYRLPQD